MNIYPSHSLFTGNPHGGIIGHLTETPVSINTLSARDIHNSVQTGILAFHPRARVYHHGDKNFVYLGNMDGTYQRFVDGILSKPQPGELSTPTSHVIDIQRQNQLAALQESPSPDSMTRIEIAETDTFTDARHKQLVYIADRGLIQSARTFHLTPRFALQLGLYFDNADDPIQAALRYLCSAAFEMIQNHQLEITEATWIATQHVRDFTSVDRIINEWETYFSKNLTASLMIKTNPDLRISIYVTKNTDGIQSNISLWQETSDPLSLAGTMLIWHNRINQLEELAAA